MQEYYRIGLTYSSNALEGNTLDLIETKVVLEDGLTINGKPIKDHLETLGHSDAFFELLKLVQADAIIEENIKYLHKLFYNRINETEAGRYRTKNVIVTGANIDFPKPKVLPEKMAKFTEDISKMKSKLHPVEYAAMLHAIFVNIHPFIDGNGSVG